MKEIGSKITRKNKIEFFKNVCSSRTTLVLLQNLRKQKLCNRGIK